jgi:hypothetical protein
MTDSETFDQWCILELLGHRRLAGRVREVQLAGAGFLRLDVPATDGHGPQTQYVAPGSVYALHPTTEEIATAAAAGFRPEPVSRWELERARPERQSGTYGPAETWEDTPTDPDELTDLMDGET